MSRLFYLFFLSLVVWAPASVSAQTTNPASKTSWGVYQIHWGVERFESGLISQIKKLGATPDYVLFFRDMDPDRGFPTKTVKVCKKHGITPVISQEIWKWSERRSVNKNWLGRINTGETDEFWKQWARAAKAFDSELIFRFGFEMNGDWFAWGQQPKEFIKAWKRVHKIMRDEGAAKVKFMFSPNVEWDINNRESAIELYYPGDEFVDLLALDGYNFGDKHSKWHSWSSYKAVFEKSIKKMSKVNKPLILAEIGCADGSAKSEWVKVFLESVRKDERVSGFIYFNHFDPNKGEPNWLLDSDPKTLKVFQGFLKKIDSSR